MNTWLMLLIGVTVAYTIGHYAQAAKDAHGRYVTNKGRMVSGFATWIKDVAMVVVILAGVIVALILLVLSA